MLSGHVGLISKCLIPYVQSVVGVDITGDAVNFNARVANLGSTPKKMHPSLL